MRGSGWQVILKQARDVRWGHFADWFESNEQHFVEDSKETGQRWNSWRIGFLYVFSIR